MVKITIDRSAPFDPGVFIGKGWHLREQDERSLAFAEVDLNNVRFEIMLKPGETGIQGKERLKRLKKAEHIRLDAKVLQTLLENKNLIPEKWKEKTNGNATCIFFDGTELWSPFNDRCVLCLYWDDGKWNWRYSGLEYAFGASGPSAVLAS